MAAATWIITGILAAIILYLVFMYNRLITTKTRAENAWSQIDVQLKRRNDLIPNLVNSVKGYMKHEKTVLENITKARAAIQKATTMASKAKADNMLSETLKSLFAVAENYPRLQANQNFLMLQEELSGTESKIVYARQFYNDNVERLNTMLLSIPTNVFGRWMGFEPKEFFKATESERKNVKVEF